MRCLGLCALLLGACIPLEDDWLVTNARSRGILVEVVEPGGYGSLLNVPPDRHRAFILPLDTVELEWFIATPPGDELQLPLWIACRAGCSQALSLEIPADALADCPSPMPASIDTSCRLGEGRRIRVHVGGAYTADEMGLSPMLMVVASRDPAISPATCLERLTAKPRAQLEPCIIAIRGVPFRNILFGLPFQGHDPPPELLAEEADTNPTVLGFTVTRERGGVREELVVDLDASVPVRRGDRLHVEPRFAADAAQEYWLRVGGDEDVPGSGTFEPRIEEFHYGVSFSEYVVYDPPDVNIPLPTWTVPHDVVPTILWLDIFDDRQGKAFVELRFVPEDAA